MDAVMEYDFPGFHALAAPLPGAFFLVVLLAAMAWGFRGQRILRYHVLLMLGFAAAGSALLFFAARAVSPASVPAADLLAFHLNASQFTLILATVALLVIGGINFYLERRTTIRRHPPDPLWTRAVGLIIILPAVGAGLLTSYSGLLLL